MQEQVDYCVYWWYNVWKHRFRASKSVFEPSWSPADNFLTIPINEIELESGHKPWETPIFLTPDRHPIDTRSITIWPRTVTEIIPWVLTINRPARRFRISSLPCSNSHNFSSTEPISKISDVFWSYESNSFISAILDSQRKDRVPSGARFDWRREFPKSASWPVNCWHPR